MFTGIIETLAKVDSIENFGTGKTFTLTAPITHELKVDQSVAHNGVCLTVIHIDGNRYSVTAIQETLVKTNLDSWKIDDWVNIERCMPANGRFDGHIVQGHVDTTAICNQIENKDGSWIFSFKFSTNNFHKLMVPKGSICINGISLTLVDAANDTFSVAIIPYTFNHTNLQSLKIGDSVNIEFDILGKYMARHIGAI
jgi:riboflavin synthase